MFIVGNLIEKSVSLASVCTPYAAMRVEQGEYLAQLPAVLGSNKEGENRPANECRSVNLSPAPAWIGSAAWNAEGDAIIVSDQIQQELSVYSTQGHRQGQVSRLKGSPEVAVRPALIQGNQNGYILEHEDGKLLFLDQSLHISGFLNLLDVCKGPSGRIGAAYSWTAAGGDVLVVGDIDKGASGWFTGLLRVRPDAPSEFKQLFKMNLDDPRRIFYHIGLPYLTHIGATGYFLLMDEAPRIYKVTDSLEPTRAIERLGLRRPQLPKISGALEYPKLYSAIEKASMPAGLYGWQGFLFLLTRSPSRIEGQTDWTLWKIDPARDAVVGRPLPLPTKSPHLIIVPGSRYWAIIEKGAYKGATDQELGKTILFPSGWIEAGAPPGPYSCN